MFDTVPDAWIAEYAESLRIEQQTGDTGPDSLATPPVGAHALTDEDSTSGHDWAALAADLLAGRRNGFSHYVCASEGERVRLLAGPFASEREASRWARDTEELLVTHKLVRTARRLRLTRLLTERSTAPRGELNVLLGVDPAA